MDTVDILIKGLPLARTETGIADGHPVFMSLHLVRQTFCLYNFVSSSLWVSFVCVDSV